MKHLNIKFLFTSISIFVLAAFMQSCSTDVGGNEDKVSPVVTQSPLTLTGDGEVIGTTLIQWSNDDPFPSTVDIYLSFDSGVTFETILVLNIPDTGKYEWDSNDVADCSFCRIRIIATDVVGNVSEPADSSDDFIINNIPQVLGTAFFKDTSNDGLGSGDEIFVTFDKNVALTTGIASEIFTHPVIGDNIGSFSTVATVPSDTTKLRITISDSFIGEDFNLHLGGNFNSAKLGRTLPSGLNLRNDISTGIIFSPETGRTATASDKGIDITSTYKAFDASFSFGTTRSDMNAMIFADMDNDGDLDLIEANGKNYHNFIWFNNVNDLDDEKGLFGVTALTFWRSGEVTTDVAVDDVDGDGDIDIVSAGSPVKVLLNDGAGDIDDAGAQVLSNSNHIALGDVDNDGDTDIVMGSGKVWLNDGGTFTDSGQVFGVTIQNTLLADVDDDGDLDLIGLNTAGSASTIWLNNVDNLPDEKGIFTDSGQSFPASQFIKAADVDSDGDVDIVLGALRKQYFDPVTNGSIGFFVGEAHVLINNVNNLITEKGIFTDSEQVIGANVNDITRDISSIVLDDMDNDGDADLILGFTGDPGELNQIWMNAAGIFTYTDSGQNIDVDASVFSISTRDLAVADVDNDGDLDLIESTFSAAGTVGDDKTVFFNSLKHPVDEIMALSPQFLGNSYTASVALGDIDGDGDLDMAVGNQEGFSDQILINNINNTAGQEGVYTISGQTINTENKSIMAFGDLDGDGDLDLVVGNDNSDSFGPANQVWLNNNGVFTDSGQLLGNVVSSHTTSVTLGDVDGDNDLDIVFTGGRGGNPNQVWLNGGGNSGSNTGVFTDSGQNLSARSQDSVLGDIDGDGDLDLITAYGSYDEFDAPDLVLNNVWLNGGDSSGSNTGVFTDSGQRLGIPFDSNTTSLALGDIDGDGDLDLVEGNNSADNRVYINNINNLPAEKGLFTVSPQTLTNGTDDITLSIVLVDIDSDGDLDIVTGNQTQSGKPGANRIWLNSGLNTGTFIDSGESLGTNNTQSIAVGDVDGDGDIDIVTGDTSNQPNQVWLNDF